MVVPGFAAMMTEMEGMEDVEQTSVKLGDASMAAPFTSRIPSVKSAAGAYTRSR
jgi:cation-transporting ATPase 13A1